MTICSMALPAQLNVTPMREWRENCPFWIEATYLSIGYRKTAAEVSLINLMNNWSLLFVAIYSATTNGATSFFFSVVDTLLTKHFLQI